MSRIKNATGKEKKNKKKPKVIDDKEHEKVDDDTVEEIEDYGPNDIRRDIKDILKQMRQLNSKLEKVERSIK